MHRRLFGGDEAGAHVHAVGTHGERGDQRTGIGHAAGGDEGDFQLVGGARQQDHVGNVVLTWVATAFETVDRNRIAADLLRLQRMPHRSAFVDDLDAGVLEMRHHLHRVAARRLDDLDATPR